MREIEKKKKLIRKMVNKAIKSNVLTIEVCGKDKNSIKSRIVVGLQERLV